jgi:hypothetical protein
MKPLGRRVEVDGVDGVDGLSRGGIIDGAGAPLKMGGWGTFGKGSGLGKVQLPAPRPGFRWTARGVGETSSRVNLPSLFLSSPFNFSEEVASSSAEIAPSLLASKTMNTGDGGSGIAKGEFAMPGF